MTLTGPQGRVGIFLSHQRPPTSSALPKLHLLERRNRLYPANRWVNLTEQGWVNSGERHREQAERALRLLGMKKRRANKQVCPCGCGRRVGRCRFNARLREFRMLAPRAWFRRRSKVSIASGDFSRNAPAPRRRSRPERRQSLDECRPELVMLESS